MSNKATLDAIGPVEVVTGYGGPMQSYSRLAAALTRCTVPLPTPRSAAMRRMPRSPQNCANALLHLRVYARST